MKFIFKAKTKSGELKEGIVDAVSSEAAVDFLQKNGLFPISIRMEEAKASWEKMFLKYYDRVSIKELVIFFRQLAILIEAKVPIIASLNAIREQSSNGYLVSILEQTINDVQDGIALSDALAKHKDVFSSLSINMIKAGETSGNLKKSIEYVADNMERNYNLTAKVRSAMMYPMIVLVVFFIIGFVVLSFIVPRLTLVIKEMQVEVPWYTSMLVNVGDFMNRYWWAIAIMMIGFISGIFYYLRTEDGKKEWDQIKLKLPVLGPVFTGVYVARFAQNLSVLLVAGIPIIRALTITSYVVNNSVYENIFLKAADEVKVGGNMSNVLRKSAAIPPIVAQMVRIGEESGQIDSVLGHVARFYEEETDRSTRNLSSLIEPILMIIVGIAVGFMAFAILMPIYNIANQIQ